MTELKMEHVLMFVIVAFLLYHFMGRCSCANRVVNGFNVGGQTDCNSVKNTMIGEFKVFEKEYNGGFDSDKKVWQDPSRKWNPLSYNIMKNEILTPGCDFQKQHFTRNSSGIINGMDNAQPTIEKYFPIKNKYNY